MFQRPCIHIVVLLVCTGAFQSRADEALTWVSPDGQSVVSLKLVDGAPRYNVTYAGKAVIRDSALGLNLDDKPFGAFEIVGTQAGAVDTSWKPVVGERDIVRDCYNHVTIRLQERAAPRRSLHIEFRAYDEGVAFRYVLPEQPALDGATASLIEAHVANQPPCRLKQKDERTLRPEFRKGKLTLATPEALAWRGLILAPNVAGLIERRTLVENLNPPCAIADPSWIKPGFVACDSQEDVQWLRRLVAIAAEHTLVLNIHDGYIADGMRRTYPNLLTQEGGGGRETNPPVTHELMLPFTRHLVGAHDHTPTLYSGQDGRTKLFELAQLVVYHGGTAIGPQRLRQPPSVRSGDGVLREGADRLGRRARAEGRAGRLRGHRPTQRAQVVHRRDERRRRPPGGAASRFP